MGQVSTPTATYTSNRKVHMIATIYKKRICEWFFGTHWGSYISVLEIDKTPPFSFDVVFIVGAPSFAGHFLN